MKSAMHFFSGDGPAPKSAKLSLKAVIEAVDKEAGAAVPIIIIGYTCVKRCVSVRSGIRVLTHMIVSPTSGMNTADVKQVGSACPYPL